MGDQITHLLSEDRDHEERIRALEQKLPMVAKNQVYEDRIHELEIKPVVTTKMLVTGVFVATALTSILPIINLIRIGSNN